MGWGEGMGEMVYDLYFVSVKYIKSNVDLLKDRGFAMFRAGVFHPNQHFFSHVRTFFKVESVVSSLDKKSCSITIYR